MSMEKIARDMRIGVFPKRSEQRVLGVGRIADNPKVVSLGLAVEPTDDELRSLHEYLRKWDADA